MCTCRGLVGRRRALLDVSPGEHAGLGGNHHFRRGFGHLAERSGVVRKTGHVGGDKSVDHRADADGFAGENAGIDGGFGVIADHAAQELHAGIDLAAVVFHAYRAIGVFQVAVRGAGSQIDPTAQVAVAYKAVVLFVGERFDDRGLDFASDFAGVAQGDEILERRVFDHPATGADVDRPAEIAEGPDDGVLFQYNRSVGGIGDAVLTQSGPGRGEHAFGNLAIIAVRNPIGEIFLQNLHVPADQFVGILEQRQFHFDRSKMLALRTRRRVYRAYRRFAAGQVPVRLARRPHYCPSVLHPAGLKRLGFLNVRLRSPPEPAGR